MKNGKRRTIVNNKLNISKVAVVGANGTMGANISAIFASFGDAKVYLISRDMEKSRNAVIKAYKSVRSDGIIKNLIPAEYSDLEKYVSDADLVFESVSEELELKKDITTRIGKCAKKGSIICSGTSGLSVTTLAECLPTELKTNYFGVHMFNPPYAMTLCEFIPTKYSDNTKAVLLKNYLTDVLRRTVVETKDSPAFLGNRIGFQFINQALIFAEQYKDRGGIDFIDAILGPFSGRAMPPIVTADFVGLDVHKAIVNNVYNNTNDYNKETFLCPAYVDSLIAENKLGRKVGCGLYKSEIDDSGNKRRMVYDIKNGYYRDVIKFAFLFADNMKEQIKNGDYYQAFETLINSNSIESNLCLNFLLEYIIYSLITAQEVGYSVHDADEVMATGFNWCPPLALLDALAEVQNPKLLFSKIVDKQVLKKINLEKLILDIEPSKYDYRKFFKSGR